MAKYPTMQVTEVGSELSNEALENSLPLIFTKVKIGDGLTSLTDYTDFAALINPITEVPITDKQVKDGQLRLTYQFNNKNIDGSFYAREIGVYAKAGENGDEILYAYTNGGETSTYVPNKRDVAFSEILTLFVATETASTVVVKVTDTTYINTEDLEEHNQSIYSHPNKANLDSPTFSGTPKAPTPSIDDVSERIATTEFVKRSIDAYETDMSHYYQKSEINSMFSTVNTTLNNKIDYTTGDSRYYTKNLVDRFLEDKLDTTSIYNYVTKSELTEKLTEINSVDMSNLITKNFIHSYLSGLAAETLEKSKSYLPGEKIVIDTKIFEVLKGKTATTKPVDNTGNIFLNGTAAIQYLGRIVSEEGRAANTAYNKNDIILNDGFAYICYEEGTSDGISNINRDSDWDNTGKLIDNEIIWKRLGDNVTDWQAETDYAVGDLFISRIDSSLQYLYKVVAGSIRGEVFVNTITKGQSVCFETLNLLCLYDATERIIQATHDGLGNKIETTYATKEELVAASDIDLDNYCTKTEAETTYASKEELTSSKEELTSDFNTKLADYYTKTEADSKFMTIVDNTASADTLQATNKVIVSGCEIWVE